MCKRGQHGRDKLQSTMEYKIKSKHSMEQHLFILDDKFKVLKNEGYVIQPFQRAEALGRLIPEARSEFFEKYMLKIILYLTMRTCY